MAPARQSPICAFMLIISLCSYLPAAVDTITARLLSAAAHGWDSDGAWPGPRHAPDERNANRPYHEPLDPPPPKLPPPPENPDEPEELDQPLPPEYETLLLTPSDMRFSPGILGAKMRRIGTPIR